MHNLPESHCVFFSRKSLQDLSYSGVTSTQRGQASACSETTKTHDTAFDTDTDHQKEHLLY